VTLYHGVMNNLLGEDRAKALKVIDDDEAFDRWLAEYHAKQEAPQPGSPGVPPTSPGMKRIGQQAYLDRFAKTYGGEE
jgi:hypothetical protein